MQLCDDRQAARTSFLRVFVVFILREHGRFSEQNMFYTETDKHDGKPEMMPESDRRPFTFTESPWQYSVHFFWHSEVSQ